MALVSDRIQKLKQPYILSSSSKGAESGSSGTNEPFSMHSSYSSSLNTSSSSSLTAPPNTVALDSGAYSIKVGDCTDKKPLTRVIPNCITKAKAERKRVFIGNEIDDCRDLSGLYFQLPCERGYVTRWDLQKTIWTHTVKPYLNDDTTLIMTQPLMNFRESQEAMDEIFFEEYYVKAMCRRYASDYLVFNHMQRHENGGTCIVVDSGYSSTWIIPYVDGVVYKKGLIRIDIGGKVLTNHMKEILSYRQLNVMEETYVINQVKEDACYVSRSFNRDMQVTRRLGSENTIARTYVLPDFNTIRRGYIAEPNCDMAALTDSYQLLKLNNERFTVPELLFQPNIIGFQQMGVAESIAHTINNMPDHMQRTLCGNVILSGGCTKLLGYKNRLGKDLRSLTPSKYGVELFVSADPVTWAWRCAASFAKVENLYSHCITRSQYEEYGSRFIYDKFEAPWIREFVSTEPFYIEETRPSLLTYNEKVFAVPEADDTVIVISDTEETAVDSPKPKFVIQAVPALSPLTNLKQVQTRSSQAILNCPPLIIAGPSAQAARAPVLRKIQIEQCLSIMGGHIVDQTAQCHISQPSKLENAEQHQKSMYMTDGKRLYRTDSFRPKTKKTLSKPLISNLNHSTTANKTDKKPISQKCSNSPRPSQTIETAQVAKSEQEQQQEKKRPIWRLVGKIPKVQGLPFRLPSTVDTCESNSSKETLKLVETKTSSPLLKAKQSNEPKTAPIPKPAQAPSQSQLIKPKPFNEPKAASAYVPSPKPTQAPSQPSQQPKPKQASESKTSPSALSQPPTSIPTQKIILKRRYESPKPTNSSPSGSVTAHLNMLSKESMMQLQQITKVILKPLSPTTLEAVKVLSVPIETETAVDDHDDNDDDVSEDAMEVDEGTRDDVNEESVACNSNGVDGPPRSKRGGFHKSRIEN